MTKLEKLAKEIFLEAKKDNEPITMAEATEMAKMEIGANEIKNYIITEKVKERTKTSKPKKVDTEKAEIIKILLDALVKNGYPATITNVDKMIEWGDYSLNLVKHRTKKGDTNPS